MKRMTLMSAAVAAGLLCSQAIAGPARAETPFYGGMAGGAAHASISSEAEISAIKVFAGYTVNSNVALEAQFGMLGTFEDEDLAGREVDANAGAASAMVTLPLANGAVPFGKLGGAVVSVDDDLRGSEDKGVLLIGAGVMLPLEGNLAVRLEWEMYPIDDDLTVHTGTAGLQVNF